MGKKLLTLLLAALIAAGLSSCAGEELHEGAARYDDAALGLALQYPSEWAVSRPDDATVRFTSPREGSADKFEDYISVSVSSGGADITAETTLNGLQQQEGSILYGAKILETSYPTIAGEQGLAYMARGQIDGADVKIYIAAVTARGKQLVLTYVSLAEEYDRFALHLSIVKSTIKIK